MEIVYYITIVSIVISPAISWISSSTATNTSTSDNNNNTSGRISMMHHPECGFSPAIKIIKLANTIGIICILFVILTYLSKLMNLMYAINFKKSKKPGNPLIY